ncbi:hypothetical protein [Microbacterium sp. Bi128]|nr:hypothetical protein [Microbacterium sp. Bi128]CAH0241679.1 hypothetical protein SRABI128_02698 [Microbacterium sp. Bi128]
MIIALSTAAPLLAAGLLMMWTAYRAKAQTVPRTGCAWIVD